MCGIAGVFGPNARGYVDAVERAMALLHHRGPDGSGMRVFDRAVLGMRRLAIIDLETGDQPISNEADSLHTVVNGEIYNYVELANEQRRAGHTIKTRSDVETVVHAYEDHGSTFPQALRGMFAIALYDESRDTLVLVRDPFGQKPLYYAELPDGGVAFASELKAVHPLLERAGVQPTISDQAIYDYLSLNFVPQPHTIFSEVRSVMPGEALVVSRDGVRSTPYWQPRVAVDEAMTYDDALMAVREGVAESVRLCLRSDVPLSAFLSGGLDSTIVVTEAVRAGASDLLTFSVSMGEATLDESPVAARTASALGLENVVVPVQVDPIADLQAVVRAYDQPYGDSSAIATYAVARATAGRRKVVLTGDGGDEVFGGYRRHLATYAASRLPRWFSTGAGRTFGPLASRVAAAGAARRSSLGFVARWTQGLGLPDAERYLKWTQDRLRERDKHVFRCGRQRATEALIEDAFGGARSWLDQQFLADARLTLPGDMLVKMDVATSAWSLEARAPLLDHVLADTVARIPRRFLFRGWRTKSLLRDAYARDLSGEVVRGAKRGFEIPVARWLAGEWRPLVEDAVLASSSRLSHHLASEFIEAVFDGTIHRDRNLASLQYGLLSMELWLREWGAR